jgi:hypothetical protein
MKHVWKALLLSCAAASLALAQGATPGEKWRIKSSMQMSGMSMPAQTMEICKPTNADAVPVKTDDNCQVYDMKRTGNTQSFKMRCTGEEPVEGSAEFTYIGSDRYQGKMLMNMRGETMTMAYEGEKLGGTCDAGAMKREVDRMMAQSQQQQAEYERVQAESCHKMAAEASSPAMMGTTCKDPEDIKTFCSAVRTHDRFADYAKAEKQARPEVNFPGAHPMSEAAKLCGFQVEAERVRLCESAEANGKLGFIASQCPVQAQALARTQCAGRSYTTISDRYRSFCADFASNQQEELSRQEQNSPTGKAKGLLNAGKKAFGLFSN